MVTASWAEEQGTGPLGSWQEQGVGSQFFFRLGRRKCARDLSHKWLRVLRAPLWAWLFLSEVGEQCRGCTWQVGRGLSGSGSRSTSW